MRLGRASEEINIGQVVRDLEPTLKPVECDEPRCRLTPNCELKRVLGEAMRAFTGLLDAYTLADIVADRRSVAKLLGIK
jgi:Rrf2 family nitric oxide-sensitive transcriptional repressor